MIKNYERRLTFCAKDLVMHLKAVMDSVGATELVLGGDAMQLSKSVVKAVFWVAVKVM